MDISRLVFRDEKTGISRVVKNIASELYLDGSCPCQIIPVQFVPEFGCYFEARAYMDRLSGRREDPAAKNHLMECEAGDLFLVLDFSDRFVKEYNKCLREFHERGVTVKFVIYDLLPAVMPENFSETILATFEQRFEAIPDFDGVVCISKAAADDFRQWVKNKDITCKPGFEITWFHLGADLETSLNSRGLPENFEAICDQLAARPSFLMVSTLEPRKGYAQALDAFEKLWEEKIESNLVIVGRQGWLVDDLVERLKKHPELGRRLFWLEGVSDECLVEMYARSSALISASLGEGFGLPLVEAAKHKKPIIARDLPVFHEVAGDRAFYFSGNSPDDLAGAVKTWLELFKKNEHPQTDGMPILSWRESAEMLLKAL